jgi:hypothetical protein
MCLPTPPDAVAARVGHNRRVTDEGLRLALADILLTLFLGVLFVLLLALHQVDVRRRRRRVAAVRAAGDFGPSSAAVVAIVAAAGGLDGAAARSLAAERRRAFEWDPRLAKAPRAARAARDRAFANERDDVARAAADEARAAALRSLAAVDTTSEADKEICREAAECAAETAAAVVAVERIPAVEFRMLTRAWRTVIGPLGVAPRKEP